MSASWDSVVNSPGSLRLMNKFLGGLILLLAISGAAENSRNIHYEVSYLGISLLDMTLTWTESDSIVMVRYDNQVKPFIANFHSIHNIYEVEFIKKSFAPLRWSKTIAEGDKQFYLGASVDPGQGQVRYSNAQERGFPEGAFTVFSATHFLASKAGDPAFFPVVIKVFIDGELWEATANRFTSRQQHPDYPVIGDQVLIQADLHFLEGKRVMEANDILMDAIATEGTRFMLWVEADESYSKAQFGEFPKAVVLDLATD